MPRPDRGSAEILLHPSWCTSPERVRLVEERTGLVSLAYGHRAYLVDPLLRGEMRADLAKRIKLVTGEE